MPIRPFLFSLTVLFAGSLPAQEGTRPPEVPKIMGSVYLDAWQVEKEFLAQPLALQEWIDLGLVQDSRLDAAKRESLKLLIGEFFSKHCPVSIRGEELAFELDRVQFIEPNTKDRILIDEGAVIPAADAVVSAVFVAPLPDIASRIRFRWDLFPEEMKSVQIYAADSVGTRVFNVDPVSPDLDLRARFASDARAAPPPPPAPAVPPSLRVPWLSILCLIIAGGILLGMFRARRAGAVSLVLLLLSGGTAAAAWNIVSITISNPVKPEENVAQEESKVILDRLLRGVYHAFNFRDEATQYDVLENVAGGEALTGIYLEARRTLETRQRDGSRVRVKGVTVKNSEPAPLENRRGFSADCEWEVSGKIGHWGHFHDRTNRYRARFVVEPLKDSWRITGLALRSRDRETGEN